jgi:hypothetical protein
MADRLEIASTRLILIHHVPHRAAGPTTRPLPETERPSVHVSLPRAAPGVRRARASKTPDVSHDTSSAADLTSTCPGQPVSEVASPATRVVLGAPINPPPLARNKFQASSPSTRIQLQVQTSEAKFRTAAAAEAPS